MGKTVLMLATLVAIVCGAHAQDSYSKEGSCPEVVLDVWRRSNSSSPFGCLSDSDCSFDLKCCLRPDGVHNCTHPVRNATSTAQTNTTTKTIKPGKCPSQRFTFGCSHGKTCSHDGDCDGQLKCCSQYNDECTSVCKWPAQDWPGYDSSSTRRPPVSPSSKPRREQPGICPSNYERYDEWWGSYDDFTCSTYCNSTDDCAEGELCCVEEYHIYDEFIDYRKRRQAGGSRCPVCKKANRDCVGDNGERTYQHGEIYTETYNDCKVCQCFNGRSRCDTICINYDNYYDHQWMGGRHWRPVWVAAGAAAGGALLISILFTLSVCCCLKCCCKDKNQTIVVHQQPPVGQQPGNAYYMSPPREEKLPLADNGYTTA